MNFYYKMSMEIINKIFFIYCLINYIGTKVNKGKKNKTSSYFLQIIYHLPFLFFSYLSLTQFYCLILFFSLTLFLSISLLLLSVVLFFYIFLSCALYFYSPFSIFILFILSFYHSVKACINQRNTVTLKFFYTFFFVS